MVDELPLIRLALIHYQFEAIHPFNDGNGRVGRLLISLLTVFWELLPLPLLYLSAYLEANQDEYNDKLLRVSKMGDWSAWIIFFLRGVAEQATDANYRFHHLLDLQHNWREKVVNLGSDKPLRIIEHLFQRPIISIPSVKRLLRCSYPTAKNNVEKLVDKGIVKEININSRPRLFVADKIIEITKRPIENLS